MPSRISVETTNRTNASRIEAARALRAAGSAGRALELLSYANGFSEDVFALRGDLQLELGQFHEALASFSALIAFDGLNGDARYRLALCQCGLERWEAAAATFRMLLSDDRYPDEAQLGLGDCLLHLRRPEEALACFEECRPESAGPSALVGKAVALQLLGRNGEAQILYERVLDLDPDSHVTEEVLANLIAMSVEAFELNRVQAYALRLSEISRGSPMVLQALTLVAFERRDYEAAGKYFQDLTRLTPQDDSSRTGDSDDEIEYRLSQCGVDRLRSLGRDQSITSAQPECAGVRQG